MEDGTICAMDFDFLFRGATVFDGTGAKAFQADVGVRGETIAAIGDLSAAGTQASAPSPKASGWPRRRCGAS